MRAESSGLSSPPKASEAHSNVQRSLNTTQLNRLLGPVVPSSPLLSGLSEPDLARLSAIIKLRAFREGEQLCQVGEPAHFFGVVLAGRLKAAIPHGERLPRSTSSGSGCSTVLQEWRLLQPGEVVGEMALFSGLVRTANVL